MHDPTEPDRHEILSGPGHPTRARKSNKKTLIITASLVGAIVAGGAGYALAANPFQSTRQEQGGAQPAPSQSGGADDEVFEADEDATMGDVTTDAPDAPDDGGLPADDDATMGDAVTDDGDSGSTGSSGSDGSTGSRGTAQTGTGKKPTTSPTKAPGQPAADNPADGPAGELSGQCAKNGC